MSFVEAPIVLNTAISRACVRINRSSDTAEKSSSVFKTKNFDPFKIMVIVFVVVFIFVFSKGIEVLTSPNPSSYSIPYDGPSKSVFEKWLPFSKDK